MLCLSDLHKRYRAVTALDGLGFSVEPGRVCGFLGANGAGKTTTMRVIFGIVRPDRGDVAWNGRPVDADTRQRFGYMPEQRGLYPKMAIGGQLAYFGRLHGLGKSAAQTAARTVLGDLGLGDRVGDRLEVLSHGNQQRAQLGAALVHDPELLVLDEPFSGLDPLGVGALAQVLRDRADRGVSVLFSSHQLDLVQDLCDDVVLISGGRALLQGSLGEVREGAGHRVVEVTFSAPSARDWTVGLPSVDVLQSNGAGTSARVPNDVDPAMVLAAAQAAGSVTSFTFRPPSVAEIFVQTVRS